MAFLHFAVVLLLSTLGTNRYIKYFCNGVVYGRNLNPQGRNILVDRHFDTAKSKVSP